MILGPPAWHHLWKCWLMGPTHLIRITGDGPAKGHSRSLSFSSVLKFEKHYIKLSPGPALSCWVSQCVTQARVSLALFLPVACVHQTIRTVASFLVRWELIQSRREQGKGKKSRSSLHCVLDSPGHLVKMQILSQWVWGWGAETLYLTRSQGCWRYWSVDPLLSCKRSSPLN